MKELNIIKETLENADVEYTESPYWLILDPRQMFRCDANELASMITGPFFSREDAKQHLDNRRYAFSKYAVVYCHSGYWSYKYKMLNRALNQRPTRQRLQRSRRK